MAGAAGGVTNVTVNGSFDPLWSSSTLGGQWTIVDNTNTGQWVVQQAAQQEHVKQMQKQLAKDVSLAVNLVKQNAISENEFQNVLKKVYQQHQQSEQPPQIGQLGASPVPPPGYPIGESPYAWPAFAKKKVKPAPLPDVYELIDAWLTKEGIKKKLIQKVEINATADVLTITWHDGTFNAVVIKHLLMLGGKPADPDFFKVAVNAAFAFVRVNAQHEVQVEVADEVTEG